MVCESCRSQARTLLQAAAIRVSGVRAAPARAPKLSRPTCSPHGAPTRRFSDTPQRRILGMRTLGESYRVLGASERLYRICAQPADYHISEEARNNDQVERLEDGEELGTPAHAGNVWHKSTWTTMLLSWPWRDPPPFFKSPKTHAQTDASGEGSKQTAFGLQPSFSTWSHVTMLRLYLLQARVRCFERDVFRNWQQQLVDHFFFDCEKKMHVDHSITSSALRQRYLKDIFVQWRGLLLAYDEGLIKGDAILASAVWRNLFKGAPEADPRALCAIVGWMRSSLASLEAASDVDFAHKAGDVLRQPVDVFWSRLEEPFKKASEGGGGQQGE
ncbi:Ubiquinol-cytochrome c chaperone, CBP3 [Metarhizium album ARSEF 1941]|uniref:Ubiquinol-cytochrome c chaperone, CBP3 n=1 Tax=Metarhizium album (strain ARSEF 1941) TaxID=1081103 RepID=A0A0B2X111_METAS|nr:Ubiquinol-cytochrome c chaperone, CBP3 [Metarhizium album ARSEF 1941]KHN99569.1 Ubiquinol-cytochrome c chaperone, CBP3 [Metarhizium album ARSEF 1941]